jgi:hypothetical protein
MAYVVPPNWVGNTPISVTNLQIISDDLTALNATDVATSGHGTSGAVVGTTDTQTLSAKTFADALTGAEIATPANPAAGYNKLYSKSDDKWYTKNSAGTESTVGELWICGYSPAPNGTYNIYAMPAYSKLRVYINGIRRRYSTDYSQPNNVSFNTNWYLTADDNVYVDYVAG